MEACGGVWSQSLATAGFMHGKWEFQRIPFEVDDNAILSPVTTQLGTQPGGASVEH